MIAKVEAAWIKLPLPTPRGLSIMPMTHSQDAVCRVTNSDGVQGIGEARDGPLDEICAIIDTVLKPRLKGEDEAAIDRLWQMMHDLLLGGDAPAKSAWAIRTRLSALAAIDMALWDIRAKTAGKTVCELLGGTPKPVAAYLTDGFYVEGQSAEEMAEECAKVVARDGYEYLKIKIGRGPEEDAERVRAVRRAVGDEVKLMVDVNQGWDRAKAEATLPRLEEFDLFWLEEPIPSNRPPDDFTAPDRLLGEIMRQTKLPLACGENHISVAECRSLIENAPLRFMQFDAVKNGGVTEFLRVADLCRPEGIKLAPHHVPHFHVQLVAAQPHGFLVETFDNPQQHVAWPDLFPGFPEVRNGRMEAPSGRDGA